MKAPDLRPDMRIDAMTSADVDDVAAIEPASSGTSAAQLHEELGRPWSRVWVARAQGAREGGAREDRTAPLAFILVWHVADELHVLNVATRPDHRRCGIGRALMAHATRYARESAVRKVFLEVRRSNDAALALYRGLGFSELGVRAAYYPDGEDAVEMVLSLAGD